MSQDDAPSLPPLLTVDEVAKETGLAVSTLRTWRSRGIGPKSFRLGGKVVYRRADVEAWIAQQEADTAKGGATPEAVAPEGWAAPEGWTSPRRAS